jgi:hypothetical protein
VFYCLCNINGIDGERLQDMKKKFILFFLMLPAVMVQAEAVRYYYLETTGTSVRTLVRTFERSGDTVKLAFRDGDSILSEVTCDGKLDQRAWAYRNMPEKTDLVFSREKNVITCSGTFKGNDFTRRYEKDNTEWLQVYEFCLVSFLDSGKKERECWTIRPTDMEAFRMAVIREGNETVLVRNNRVEAVKVRVTAAGPLSIFWSSWYWFRSADLVFVKYEAVRGGPGTPLTVIELVREENME